MSLYVVQPSKTNKNIWTISVDNVVLVDVRFSSFEMASAYVHWLTMQKLLKLWLEDSGVLYEKLKLHAEKLHARWLAAGNVKRNQAELNKLAIWNSRLGKVLHPMLVAHMI
ncbi:hypothetical protein D3C75_1182430 [compost metagenome]